MTVASAPVTSRSSAHGRVEGFVRKRLPRLEGQLRDAVEGLSGPVEALQAPLERAMGLRGHRGSRWRPLLSLAVAECLEVDADDVVAVAVAVELTHTASLVLDDLPCMDDAEERRGIPATHRMLGSAGAILLALGLLARAAEVLGTSPRGGGLLVSEWGRTFGLQGMAGGQALDLAAGGRLTGARRRLHRKKTTALSAFALSGAARAAGSGDAERRVLERFGRDVGWAYQLADDARDRAEDAALGRQPGGRKPREQSHRLLERALGHLAAHPSLDTPGRRLLEELATSVVEGSFPVNGPSPRDAIRC